MCYLSSVYKIEIHMKYSVTVKALKYQQGQICSLLYLSVWNPNQIIIQLCTQFTSLFLQISSGPKFTVYGN